MEFRQEDHTAVRMHEELNAVSWLQPEMFANSLRDRRLTLDSDLQIPSCLHYNFVKVIPWCTVYIKVPQTEKTEAGSGHIR